MYCPRLDHFARLNADHSIGKCGHMVAAPGFPSYHAMQDSDWLAQIKQDMANDIWPSACHRCQQMETAGQKSVRENALVRHQVLTKIRSDYVIVSGVLDNICNSACQSCNPMLSTKIGSLHGKNYIKIDNGDLLDQMPWPRVVELDINGGEPTASAKYGQLLERLPNTVQVVRINTNGSRLLPQIATLLEKRIQTIVTLSLDGVDRVHDYVRWPIRWKDYVTTVDRYLELQRTHKNLRLQTWTVLHALNIGDFHNIQSWSRARGLEHGWAYLHDPAALDVTFANTWTTPHRTFNQQIVATKENNQAVIDDFICAQDKLRGINIKDYQ